MTAAVRVGSWHVWLAEGEPGDPHARARQWLDLVARLDAAPTSWHSSKHAVTHRVLLDGETVYVKRYRRYRVRTQLKDMVRASKARHAMRVGVELAAAGFVVPRVLAAGDERRGPLLRGAWLATATLDGVPLAERLATLAAARRREAPSERRRLLAAKRRLLASLGSSVGQLHAAGFVAGDLVPANVWSAGADRDGTIALLDHDRTRRGPAPAPWGRARRNLVQLNRFALPGVVMTDRLRVYRGYAAARGWGRDAARRRLPWVIAKTIERRRRFDGIDDAAARGFRDLMRAPGGGE
ncbi:MAG TPA: lipopolysaccharide kinase InaA family protein [Candidatus Binatia bacterium]|jgi:tRNA A-37 threonylcarbamoyl transferase component Bud32